MARRLSLIGAGHPEKVNRILKNHRKELKRKMPYDVILPYKIQNIYHLFFVTTLRLHSLFFSIYNAY